MSEITTQAADVQRLKAALEGAQVALKGAKQAAEDYAQAEGKSAEMQRAFRVEVIARTRAVEAAKAEYVAAAEAQAESDKQAAEAQKKLTQAQADHAKKLEKINALASKGLSEELPEKLKDAREALGHVGDKTLTLGERFTALRAGTLIGARALAGYVGVATGAIQTIGELVRAEQEALAVRERLAMQSREVASSMDAVRAATHGAGTEADAASVRQALLAAGIAATGDRIGAVLEAARQNRQSNEDNAASAQRVISALQGNVAAQDQLGIRTNANATAAEKQADALRQLGEANRRAGALTQTAAEAQRQAEQGSEAASRGVTAFGVSILRAIPPTRTIIETYGLLGRAGQWLGEIQETNAGTEEEAIARAQRRGEQLAEQAARTRAAAAAEQARAQAEAQARDAATAAAQTELGVLAEQARMNGELVDSTIASVTAREAYTRAVLATQMATKGANESDAAFAQRQTQLLGQQTAARERALQAEQRASQQRRAADDLGVIAAQARAHGAIVSSQVRSVSLAERQRHLAQEIRDLHQSDFESIEQFNQRSSQLIQQHEAGRQALLQAAQLATQTRQAREQLRLLEEQTQANPLLRTGFTSDMMLRLDPRGRAQVEQLERDAYNPRGRGNEENELATLQRRTQALQQINQLLQQQYDLANGIASADARLGQHQGDTTQLQFAAMREADNAARTQAIGQNADQFAQLRAGIGRQTMLAQLSRESARGLFRGTTSEADLRGEIDELEARASDALAEGTRQSAQRAARYMEEAQALAGVVQQHHALADSMREANNVSVQFGAAFAGSEEAAHGAGFTMADLAKTSKGAFDVMGGAASSAFTAYIEGSASAEEALSQFGRNALKGLAEYFIGQAVAYTATGLGMLAVQNYPGAGLAFAAAGGFGAAAALAGGVYMATAPTKPADASTASTAGTGSQARGSESGAGAGGGSVTYEFNFNGLLSTRDAAAEIARVQDAGSRMGIRPNFAERS